MKQYYESEVLYKLMERDGFNIPSSVPPYESEIKAYLINQVKQAYPKLTDYEAEWLLYNYTNHLPADFPISSVSNVTNATFENVVPFAYQSAILKGNTLVNLLKLKQFSTGLGYQKNVLNMGLKSDTKYIFIADAKNEGGNQFNLKYVYIDGTTGNDFALISKNKTGKIRNIFTTPNNQKQIKNIDVYNAFSDTMLLSIDNMMIIEYQEGMENWDIPYFEGMQSVKMPVLTTTGKNLINIDNHIKYNNGAVEVKKDGYNSILATNTYNGSWQSSVIDKVRLKANTTYTLSYEYEIIENPNGFSYGVVVALRDTVSNISGDAVNGKTLTFTTDKDYDVANLHVYVTDGNKGINTIKFTNIQLEESTQATTYEPYKTNILTVNEDVELRGIGDVQDTLDCLTGELTERIGEIVLDGVNISPTENNVNKQNNTIGFDFKTSFPSLEPSLINSLNDTFPDYTGIYLYNNDVEGIARGWDVISVRINKNRLTQANVEGFKQWLSQNPIKVQYKLATESVKKVDLTTVNENGESVYFMPLEGTMNVSCSSQTINPTFDMSVPVEATTQNIASFINLEMEE